MKENTGGTDKQPSNLISCQDKPVKEESLSAFRFVLKDLGALLLRIAMILFIFWILVTFVFGLHRNTEYDMHPFIKDGDVELYFRLGKEYIASDVIVFERNGKLHSRRIIAVAGDTVDIGESGLMINGAYMDEPDIYEHTTRYAEGIAFPLQIPEGAVFVLGDSREHSEDSRIYGCIPIEDIRGKVMAVLRRRNI